MAYSDLLAIVHMIRDRTRTSELAEHPYLFANMGLVMGAVGNFVGHHV